MSKIETTNRWCWLVVIALLVPLSPSCNGREGMPDAFPAPPKGFGGKQTKAIVNDAVHANSVHSENAETGILDKLCQKTNTMAISPGKNLGPFSIGMSVEEVSRALIDGEKPGISAKEPMPWALNIDTNHPPPETANHMKTSRYRLLFNDKYKLEIIQFQFFETESICVQLGNIVIPIDKAEIADSIKKVPSCGEPSGGAGGWDISCNNGEFLVGFSEVGMNRIEVASETATKTEPWYKSKDEMMMVGKVLPICLVPKKQRVGDYSCSSER